jgi:lipopolysaccharide transport system ATP-binding protein
MNHGRESRTNDDVVVSVKNASKKFCKHLRRSMAYGIMDLSKNLLGIRPNSTELRKDEFWALDDISFDLRRGEALGLIGVNGSGKTTLLRLLTGIFPPDKGEVFVKGRVGALIAVGAGFHPHMTGRENIFLNGVIMGMSRKEIDSKFNDIVDFSDIGNFLESPVSTYSSGMRVRLGFSIATAVEPDILLIDEILAVGDMGFRTKCYHVISKLLKHTAVIFVTHSMPLVHRIAQKSMVLDKGKIHYVGRTPRAIMEYYNLFEDKDNNIRTGSGIAKVDSFIFDIPSRNDKSLINYGEPLRIEIEVSAYKDIRNLIVDIVFRNISNDVIAECNNYIEPFCINLQDGERKKLEIKINEFTLNPGIYNVAILLMSYDMVDHYDWIRTVQRIEVSGENIATAGQQFKAEWKMS